MKNLLTIVLTAAVVVCARGQETNKLAEPLEPLRPFLKTWKGEFKQSTPEKPMIDIQKWERALNGQAVRVTHSINQGRYGGETLLVPKPKTSDIEFYYFTTASFYTKGTVKFEGKKIITLEEVSGNEDGITHVRGTPELLPNGKRRVVTSYFKKGAWEDGRDMTYEPAPGAEVIFK